MRNRMSVAAAAIAASVVLVLSACAPDVDDTSGEEQASMPPASALPEQAEEEHEHGYDEHELVPVPDEDDRAGIADAAAAAFDAYADKDQAYTDWFDGLKPHLHESAREAYATVQPQSIPAMEREGDPVVLDGSTDAFATVELDTSAGGFRLEMRHDGGEGDWLASRISPVE